MLQESGVYRGSTRAGDFFVSGGEMGETDDEGVYVNIDRGKR